MQRQLLQLSTYIDICICPPLSKRRMYANVTKADMLVPGSQAHMLDALDRIRVVP